jgi:hypothetical protein
VSPSDVTPWLMVAKAIYDAYDYIACKVRARQLRRRRAAKKATK